MGASQRGARPQGVLGQKLLWVKRATPAHVTHGRGPSPIRCGRNTAYCAFAHKAVLGNTALLLPGATCKPRATVASTNTSPENTLLNLLSKLRAFLCTSKADHCDGEVTSPLSWSLSQTSRAMTFPPPGRNRVSRNEENPYHLRLEVRI